MRPIWNSTGWGGGRSHYIDVEGLRREPKVRWVSQLEPYALVDNPLLSVSPLGIMCAIKTTPTFQVLDPETGVLRWEASWNSRFRWPTTGTKISYLERWPEIVEDTVTGWQPPHCVGWDLRSGEELYRVELGDYWRARVWGSLLLCIRSDSIVAYPFDRYRGPSQRLLWKTESPFELGYGVFREDLVLADVAVVGEASLPRSGARDDEESNEEAASRQALVLNATGDVLSTIDARSVLVDSTGLAVSTADCLTLCDLSGRPTWTRAKSAAVGLSPDLVVGVRGDGRAIEMAIVDRHSGIDRWSSGALIYDYGALAITNDVVYDYVYSFPESFAKTGEFPPSWEPNRLRATSATGEQLWELPDHVVGNSIMGLAPMPGRLFGLTQSNSVFCLA